MNTNVPLIFIIFIILKHLICDFFLQGPYQFLNKGNLKHPGGYVHAGINGIGMMVTLAIVVPQIGFGAIFLLGVVDFVTHYAIDYSKINLNERMKWGPLTSKEYWYSLGIDQTLHWFVYTLIIYMALAARTDDFGGWFITSMVMSFIGVVIASIIRE